MLNSTSLNSHIQEIVGLVGYTFSNMIDVLPDHDVRR